MVIVEKSRCPENHLCPLVKRCPVSAITQKGFEAPVINHDKCIECGICARLCPFGAFKEAALTVQTALLFKSRINQVNILITNTGTTENPTDIS